jgi:hypothetical protein
MADERWVTQSEAARLLSVAQSSISRFIAANADVPVRRNGRGHVETVEFNALVEARGGSLSVQDKAAEKAVAPPAPAADRPFEDAAATPRRRDLRDVVLELDIAERKGELLDRQAMQTAIETAGLSFSQALDRRRRSLASRFASMTEAREIEIELKSEDRKLMEALVHDLIRAAEGLEVGLEESAAPA